MNKIAIIVTTFCRDNLLKEAVASMEKYAPENCVILIGDQGCKYKKDFLVKAEEYKRPKVRYYNLPFDCGLSKSRNFLVDKAQELGCQYCLISSESMIFNEKTQGIEKMIPYLESGDFDLIGFDLKGIKIYWVGNISLIPGKCFNLDFIDRSKSPDIGPIYKCNIVHNFFLSKINTLLKVRWNENLKLSEHELWFNDYSNAGYKVGYTPEICCNTIKTRDGEFGRYRLKNWQESLQKLYKLCGIKSWIQYQNRENGFWGINKVLLDRRK